MKIEAIKPLQYTASPLKVIQTHYTGNTPLRVFKREDVPQNQHFSFIVSSINDPEAWDASWFANYK